MKYSVKDNFENILCNSGDVILWTSTIDFSENYENKGLGPLKSRCKLKKGWTAIKFRVTVTRF